MPRPNGVYYSLVINEGLGQIQGAQWVQSIASLRKYNRTIPVWLMVYDSVPDFIRGTAERFNATVIECGGYEPRLASLAGSRSRALAQYPTLHKFLALDTIPLVHGGKLLYLDCDTYLFGDVQRLFDRYPSDALYAREEPYSSLSYLGRDPWAVDEAALSQLMVREGIRGAQPFNSGVCLLGDAPRLHLIAARKKFLSFAWRLLVGLCCGSARDELSPELIALVESALIPDDIPTALPFPSGNHWIVAQVALWLTISLAKDLPQGRFCMADVAQDGELVDFRRSSTDGLLIAHYFTSHEPQFEEWLKHDEQARCADTFSCRLDHQPNHLAPAQCLERVRRTRVGGAVLSPRFYLENVAREQAVEQVHRHYTPPNHVCITDPDFGVMRYSIGPAGMQVLEGLRAGRLEFDSLDPDTLDVLSTAGILVRECDAKPLRSEAELARLRDYFQAHGYVPIECALHPFALGSLRAYYRSQVRGNALSFGDDQSALRFVRHNEPAALAFHANVGELVSSITGRAVKPSYVYAAAYQGGAELPPHVDRAQCEFTASVLIDFSPEEIYGRQCPWPLELHEVHGRTTSVFQEIGDALLFKGRDIIHSRPPLAADMTSTSVLFHFVEEDFAADPR